MPTQIRQGVLFVLGLAMLVACADPPSPSKETGGDGQSASKGNAGKGSSTAAGSSNTADESTDGDESSGSKNSSSKNGSSSGGSTQTTPPECAAAADGDTCRQCCEDDNPEAKAIFDAATEKWDACVCGAGTCASACNSSSLCTGDSDETDACSSCVDTNCNKFLEEAFDDPKSEPLMTCEVDSGCLEK